jgi:hypothetical protein
VEAVEHLNSQRNRSSMRKQVEAERSVALEGLVLGVGQENHEATQQLGRLLDKQRLMPDFVVV